MLYISLPWMAPKDKKKSAYREKRKPSQLYKYTHTQRAVPGQEFSNIKVLMPTLLY